jgi:hypothetical protein
MRKWMPTYVPALHDRVTLENCAAACQNLKLGLAGVDSGNHCWCGTFLPALRATSAQNFAHFYNLI